MRKEAGRDKGSWSLYWNLLSFISSGFSFSPRKMYMIMNLLYHFTIVSIPAFQGFAELLWPILASLYGNMKPCPLIVSSHGVPCKNCWLLTNIVTLLWDTFSIFHSCSEGWEGGIQLTDVFGIWFQSRSSRKKVSWWISQVFVSFFWCWGSKICFEAL